MLCRRPHGRRSCVVKLVPIPLLFLTFRAGQSRSDGPPQLHPAPSGKRGTSSAPGDLTHRGRACDPVPAVRRRRCEGARSSDCLHSDSTGGAYGGHSRRAQHGWKWCNRGRHANRKLRDRRWLAARSFAVRRTALRKGPIWSEPRRHAAVDARQHPPQPAAVRPRAVTKKALGPSPEQ